MFKIKNITTGKVIIGDLGIVFSRNEEKDLHELFPRSVVEKSQNIKAAIAYGKLSEPEIDEEPEEHVTIFAAPKSTGVDEQIAAMERRLQAQIRSLLSQQGANHSPDQLQQKLDLILKAIATGGNNQKTNVPAGADETFEDVDDDKLIDIQMRTLERLTRNSEGQVSAKEEHKESDVGQRADELEGLL